MATATIGRRNLSSRLDQLQFRGTVIGVSAALLGGLTAAVVALVVCAWLDLLWELSPALRSSAGWLAAFAAFAAGSVVYATVRRANRHAALARRIDDVGATGGEVLSAYDLEKCRAQPTPLGTGLATLAIRRASALVDLQSPGSIVPARPQYLSLLSLAAAALVVTVLAFAAPNLAHTEWLRFTDPYGDHPPYSRIQFAVKPGDANVLYGADLDIAVEVTGPPVEHVDLVVAASSNRAEEVLPMFPESSGHWRASLMDLVEPAQYFVRSGRSRSNVYRIEVETVPQIESVRFRIIPPEYTHQAAYEGPLPTSGLEGLPGTKVEVVATSNRPLSGGRLEITQKSNGASRVVHAQLEPDRTNTRAAIGSFEIAAAGSFRVIVADTAGQESPEGFSGGITLLEDQRPFVRILRPQAASVATPDATIPVQISAEDDYGVANVQLFRSLNDSAALPLSLPVSGIAPRRVETSSELPLAAYGLSPGDVIKLFARVEDNDPHGPKGSESPLAAIQIISQQEFERMIERRNNLEMLLSKYRQAQRRVEDLKEQKKGLRKKIKDEPNQDSPETAEDLEKLAQRMQDEAKAIREAAEARLPYDLDGKYAEHLQKLAERMESAAKEVQRLSKNRELKGEDLAKALDGAFKPLEEGDLDFEQNAMEPLELLEQVFPLMADQARFVALYERQRELAERLSALKGRDNEDSPSLKARMRDLEAEQREIRAALETLLDDIDDHITRLPEDAKFDDLRESAKEFVEKARECGALEAMTDAEGALSEFAGTKAHEKAKEAADLLEALLGKCEGMKGQAGMCMKFAPSLSEALGNTVEQLLADMGLGSQGQGSGRNGFSVRGNSLRNMGLYGRHPALGGGDGKHASGRSGRPGGGVIAQSGNPQSPSDASADNRSTTVTNEGQIPARYRKRVSQYFQRVVEDLDQE